MMQWLNDFAATAQSKLTQFNNSTFKDAAMAVCALVASADGEVEPEEKKKVASLIAKNEMLQVFNAVELKQTFEKFCEMAADDFARLDLLNIVRKVKGNDAQADTALKVGIIIANSDGEFEPQEKLVVAELCGVLGLPSSQYVAA